jgi:plasmid stability protein
MTDQPKMLAAVVDEPLADAFKAVAAAHERTVAAELRKLIKEHVESYRQDEEPVR